MAFFGLQQHFIRNVCAKFGIPQSPQSPDIGKNSDQGISDFRISGQSLIKINCHISRTSDDIDMKLRQVTKLNTRNKATSKKMMITSCQKIVTSLPLFQFTANLEQSTQSVKLTFSLIVTFYLTKTESRNKISLTQLSHYSFE